MYGKDTLAALWIGGNSAAHTHNTATVEFRIDATNDKYSTICRAPKAMSVDDVAVNLVNTTGAPLLNISIQGVDASGLPDGTKAQNADFTPADGINWITLGGSVSTTKNAAYAIVIEDASSGQDPDGSNYTDFVMHNFEQLTNSIPYAVVDAAGAGWNKATHSNQGPIWGMRNSGTTDDVMGNPVETHLTADLAIVGANDVIGQKFVFPPSFGRRVKVHGCHIAAYADTDYRIGIWDSSATPASVVVTGTLDKDFTETTNNTDGLNFWDGVWLNTGETYYLGLELLAGGAIILYADDYVTDDSLSACGGHPNNNVWLNTGASWVSQAGYIATAAALLVSGWDPRKIGVQEINSGVSAA